jgi:MFS family permease
MEYGTIAVSCGLFLLLLLQRNKEQAVKLLNTLTIPRFRDVLKHRQFVFAIWTAFFDTFSSASLFVFLPFLLLARGIDPALLGAFASVFFLGNLCGKFVLGRFADMFKKASVVMLSELLMAVCIVALASSTSVLLILLFSIIAGIFTKGTIPVIQTMVAEASEHHGHFEQSFAVSGFMNAIALTISPVFLGFISDQWGITAAFYAMAIVATCAIVPAFLFRTFRS